MVLSLVPVALGGGEACVELGFSSSLLCGSCDELRQFSLNALEDSCKKCCQTEGSNSVSKVCDMFIHMVCCVIYIFSSQQKYAGALIEVCG